MIPREELESTNNPITITKQEHNTTTTTRASSWGARSKDPRIVRVSRALGGKDRHSKVCTVRGLRDRRVRLSVPTAIQLYDLQDRLGLNQPSKAVDWLLNAAKHDIDELPPLQFPQGGLVGPGFNFQPITGFQDFAPATQALIKDRASGETSSSNVGNDETGETRFVSLQHHQQGEVNDFLSRQNFSTNQNHLATWEPPNLTLNHFHHQHPSIGLGLNAHHHHQNDQDSQSFGLNNQVFFYHHHHHQLPYFPHTNAELDQKQPNFVPELSNSVRPFQFSMSTTANLLPFQNNAVNDENKRDELR